MAGDWIKMRSDLYRDPKVSVIADELMSPDGRLAAFVSQNCQCEMSVTRNVMRNVTVGALVSVWGVMRQRGKRSDIDLHCDGVSLAVLDDIADLPGFGAAMEVAGWVLELPQGLVFPKFFEDYNVEPGQSANAERQRRFREKQALQRNGESNVTRNVTVTPREEKSREEKKEKHRERDALALPDWLSPESWQDWHRFRNARKGWTHKARELSLRTLAELRSEGHDPKAVIEQSIERGWTGLFPIKRGDAPSKPVDVPGGGRRLLA